ncbi:uncharacterized protein LACBIDRAFT_321600 [Laccaria bicolor S238N-H82]|uniref:Predicted protein n=1 Tax=Laccaria bicolor (strain S238N-H82 / ATCC MYA-4686) TaxID=486041 RepID=B0CTH9_LACBS|nr:uncharacterized protein LACBIDRAFT_321600 [Laccaria bicolor S238N-H82]EDR14492.1 predicted protein [Laccaria bicolor S238N-H82]|eukprot:XP_001875051.1 predicted protein [Laccaria bicolor S238N-H82]
MKAFGVATLIALSALINGSSALWCGCYMKEHGFWGIDIWITGEGIKEGGSWFGLTQSNWCNAHWYTEAGGKTLLNCEYRDKPTPFILLVNTPSVWKISPSLAVCHVGS